MITEVEYADTWGQSYSHNGGEGLLNETAYVNDSPNDYYFGTGSTQGVVDQWEPDALIQIDDQIDSFKQETTEKKRKSSKHPHRAHSQRKLHKSHP